MEKHTPTPWRINGTNSMIVTDDRVICELGVNEHLEKFSYEEYKANSELIVKAVNNHEQLVETLKDAKEAIEGLHLRVYQSSEMDIPYPLYIRKQPILIQISALLSQLESK